LNGIAVPWANFDKSFLDIPGACTSVKVFGTVQVAIEIATSEEEASFEGGGR